jgi:hypothetical protein
VKQQKLLWAFSLRSTTETIQNVEGFLTTCRTPKTSLNIFSQINSASNKKFGKLFTNLRNNKKFPGQFFSDKQQKQHKIWKAFSNLWNNKNFFGHFVMDQQRKQ